VVWLGDTFDRPPSLSDDMEHVVRRVQGLFGE